MLNCCLFRLGEQYERKAEKMGTGKVVFEKDQKQRKIKYKKFTDDGVKKLHEARFAPLPTGDPQTWADQVPVKRDQVMKNLYMAHYGMGHGQVDTKTIAKVRRISEFYPFFGKLGVGSEKGGGGGRGGFIESGGWVQASRHD
jgi:hypothetical protein